MLYWTARYLQVPSHLSGPVESGYKTPEGADRSKVLRSTSSTSVAPIFKKAEQARKFP